MTVDAYTAALLRTDVNSDPMGIYPVKVNALVRVAACWRLVVVMVCGYW